MTLEHIHVVLPSFGCVVGKEKFVLVRTRVIHARERSVRDVCELVYSSQSHPLPPGFLAAEIEDLREPVPGAFFVFSMDRYNIPQREGDDLTIAVVGQDFFERLTPWRANSNEYHPLYRAFQAQPRLRHPQGSFSSHVLIPSVTTPSQVKEYQPSSPADRFLNSIKTNKPGAYPSASTSVAASTLSSSLDDLEPPAPCS